MSAVGGVWSVATALAAAIVALLLLNRRRLPALRASVDAGANAAVLPAFSVASLVGFGAVVAALPAFALVRDWVLGIGGGPLVSLAVATNVLSALTGSASGGLTIALDALGPTYMRLAAEHGIDPALLHRVAVIGAGTLDSLPHNGAVVTLLAVCGSTHREELFRHRHGRHRRCAFSAGRRHRARQPARIVLNRGYILILRHLASVIVLAVASALAAGCAIPPRGPAVPSSETVRALPLGIPNARFFADDDPAPMLDEGMPVPSSASGRHCAPPAGRPQPMPPASFLAVSGGGDNGAFGAGLLNGWTATRHAARVQDRDRRQHRRTDRALRLPRTRLRSHAARSLYDDRS